MCISVLLYIWDIICFTLFMTLLVEILVVVTLKYPPPYFTFAIIIESLCHKNKKESCPSFSKNLFFGYFNGSVYFIVHLNFSAAQFLSKKQTAEMSKLSNTYSFFKVNPLNCDH